MTVQISLFFRPYQLPKGVPLSASFDVARAMDEAGIHSIAFGDHLVVGTHFERYPGIWKHPQDAAWPEPLTTLAGMAAVTKNLRLATSILLAPLRGPVVLAKTIATLDALSNGRTQLALGLGWQPEEYDAVNIPWEERYKRLDETVETCRALWGEQPVRFHSPHVTLDGVWSMPRPAQPRVPLLYGVKMSAKHAARIARLGDGWCPVRVDLNGIRDGIQLLTTALQAEGRALSDQHIRVGLPSQRDAAGKVDIHKTLAAAQEYAAVGATILTLEMPLELESMSEIFKFIDAVGRAASVFR